MKVVIIEDDPEIIEAISLCFDLRWADSEVFPASEGVVGVQMVEKHNPDIVILDIGLPDIDGFEVCRRIRLFSDVPIIMLTARDKEFDKVKGLEIGADDYVTKPFSHIELLARLRVLLRRSSRPDGDEIPEPLVLGNLRIDFGAHEVFKDGEKLTLTPTEYNLLALLAQNAGRVMSHQDLLRKVWGEDYVDSTDYLKVYTQRLRIKLDDDARNPKLILSERGVGYKFAKPRDDTKYGPRTPAMV